jgi:hypothetical protein
MNATHAELVANILALPQTERADLAFQLLQSLDPPGPDAASDGFGDTLRERAQAAVLGNIESISLDEMRESLNQRFGNRASS